LAARVRERPLEDLELVAEEDYGYNESGKNEEKGHLLHEALYRKHLLCLAPIHLTDAVRAGIHELRIDQLETQ
jgi:hypothetical protein